MDKGKLIEISSIMELYWAKLVKVAIDYDTFTDFGFIFHLAEMEDVNGDEIKKQYRQAILEHGKEYRYMTELFLLIMWREKILSQYENCQEWYIYVDLMKDLEQWCETNFYGDELEYFHNIINKQKIDFGKMA